MQSIEMAVRAREKRGEWKAGLPGALAVLGAVGFAVGIVEEGMRERLPALLAACAALALIGGVLWWLGKRSLSRAFVIGKDDAGAFVRLEGVGELREPLSYQFGWYPEHLEAGVVHGTVSVLFVAIEGTGGKPICVRKALGAAFSAPHGWKSSLVLIPASHAVLEIEQLPRALDRIGAERREQELPHPPAATD